MDSRKSMTNNQDNSWDFFLITIADIGVYLLAAPQLFTQTGSVLIVSLYYQQITESQISSIGNYHRAYMWYTMVPTWKSIVSVRNCSEYF